MPRRPAAVYVAATRQHVGKTSTCLGLLHGLTARLDAIGFLKPVGQESVFVEHANVRVDKDVAVAKEVFRLKRCRYADMSPVVIPAGYTRDYLDGRITFEQQLVRIQRSFERIIADNDYTVVEGTGHTGVGSIVDINNARVAAELGVDMVLVANGGLGSAFDDLALNYSVCRDYGVRIRGVILNKVRPDKLEMVKEYFPKALRRWDVPLIGVVPNLPTLANQSMADFESLFRSPMLAGQDRRFHQFARTCLVTSGLRRFLDKLESGEFDDALFVTHATRNDVILAFLSHVQDTEQRTRRPFGGGLILTGQDPPQDYTMRIIRHARAPVLYAPVTTFDAMDRISRFTAKFNASDRDKVLACGRHYASHLDFDLLLDR